MTMQIRLFSNTGHPSTRGAGEPRLCDVSWRGTPDVQVVDQDCLRNLSSELSLERFDSRFRPFGAGIINEIFISETFSGLDGFHHLDIRILFELQLALLYSPTLALD